MPFPAGGPSRYLHDALDRRDDALWRGRRIMFLVSGGAVTAALALGVVFAQELPGHSAVAGPATGAGSGQAGLSGGGTQPGAASQGGSAGAQSGAGQAQPAAPAPAPAPPQVVSGGS